MKSFYFILISAFLMGVISGGYIYFASRDEEPVFDLEELGSDTTFDISADAYGGCARIGCASYHIDVDGSVDILLTSRDGEDRRGKEQLSSNELRDLRRALHGAPLQAIEASTFTGTCPITYDGLAYTYSIHVDDETYTIDTCAQHTEDEPLFDILESYFREFDVQ